MQSSKHSLTAVQTYKRLLAYLRSMKTMLVISIIGAVIFAVSAPAFVHLFKLFISEKQSNSQLVYYIPLAVVIVAFIRGIGSYLSRYYIGKMGEKVTHILRCQFFDKLLYLPKSFFDSRDSGKLISVITYNIGQINDAVSRIILQLLQDGLMAIALLCYLIWLSWELTLIFLVVGIPIGIFSNYIGKKIRSISSSVQNSMGELTSIGKEGIESNTLIKCYQAEQMESKRFKDSSFYYFCRSVKLIRTNSTLSPIIHLMISISIACVMIGILTIYKHGTPSDIIAYIVASAGLPTPIRTISNSFAQILRAIIAARSVFEVLDLPNEVQNGSYDKIEKISNIEFKNLSYKYPDSDDYAIKNLNLNIKKGETVAIVGSSGSGKSTLIALLLRLHHRFEGEILIDSIPIRDYNLKDLRRHFALVSQHIKLFNTTVYDNIAFGELATKTEELVLSAAKVAYVDEFVKGFSNGYQTMVGENGNNLSGGQRQRIAIARAILKDAPVLILDEATSALDRISEKKIRDAINKMIINRTTIIIAHRLSTVTKADKIIVLEDGTVQETGTHQELLKLGGRYKKLFNTNYIKNE